MRKGGGKRRDSPMSGAPLSALAGIRGPLVYSGPPKIGTRLEYADPARPPKTQNTGDKLSRRTRHEQG